MKFLLTGTCAIAMAIAGLGASPAARADATMPTCAAGDSVVWENTSTKVYHAQGDAYFGKTKKGQYACKSDADKAGFHLSGSKSKAGASAASGAAASSATDAPDAAASPTGKKHRHKKGTMASPAPDAMGSPDAMASPSGKHHHHHKHGSMASPSPAPAAT